MVALGMVAFRWITYIVVIPTPRPESPLEHAAQGGLGLTEFENGHGVVGENEAAVMHVFPEGAGLAGGEVEGLVGGDEDEGAVQEFGRPDEGVPAHGGGDAGLLRERVGEIGNGGALEVGCQSGSPSRGQTDESAPVSATVTGSGDQPLVAIRLAAPGVEELAEPGLSGAGVQDAQRIAGNELVGGAGQAGARSGSAAG